MKNNNEAKKCRHNRTWLVAGGHVEWCYQCGALRKLKPVASNIATPVGRWVRPSGIGGENPWTPLWDDKNYKK